MTDKLAFLEITGVACAIIFPSLAIYAVLLGYANEREARR
jgi:hypothetical protein